jgi:hypothetical protein
MRNDRKGSDGAEDFFAGQNLRRKNLVFFSKQINLVGIPSGEICPPKFIKGEIPVAQLISWPNSK